MIIKPTRIDYLIGPFAALVACSACGKRTAGSEVSLTVPGDSGAAAQVVAPNEVGVSIQCPPGMTATPGGTYTRDPSAGPVTTASLCVDTTEVTVEAYGTCVAAKSCTKPKAGTACNFGMAGHENQPINCVDWNESTTYCEAQKKRLPTEDEWEWIARGGDHAWTYPWGNESPHGRVCWEGDGVDPAIKFSDWTPCPVGRFPTGNTPSGIKDLADNVSEWTSSPFTSDNSTSKVARGGHFHSSKEQDVSAKARWGLKPTTHSYLWGFRCVQP
jgi:sulfatase modifying factor 1